ncbi:septal ring lytic transglycosylase RlpA family protein [Cardiobacterium valvarum]|jgi:rare lipoprotein A|uniref:Endolytic peptidoglycan transglycosylase RlpA n=1 Tax=Cardiobacterium valvarum TaxID=194702 RepID=A0A381E264_9GAMM|nr:septal ring lytic transglycosylase RlpA family protein [Cardiobacterium valvarum]RKW16485.1 MAG: septal ring lytic transglycosylase RlpA family protein [Cardiobacterium sp.]SUX20072.1 RlpA-like protein precursor [Cardiobacterium valvarum]
MNVKQLLVLTIAAAALTAQAEETAADKAEPASATAEQQVNIVKVIDFTQPQKTLASQEAKTKALLAGEDRKALRNIDFTRPNLRNLVDNNAKGDVITKSSGRKSYSYTVLGKRYQTLADSKGFEQQGPASWYGNPFHGRKTANGETYNMNEMTAAHKELPLGTRVEVTNLSNGRKVVVRINDRGPFHGNRVLDLSRAAAQELGTLNAGVAQVQIRALQ